MKNLLFKVFLLCLLLTSNAYCNLRGLEGFVHNEIDATKNARLHSSMGNIYFSEKNYISALKEYEIAYSLVKNTLMGSSYLYNMSMCYTKLKQYKKAQELLIKAIEKDSINLTYYKALVQNYKLQNTLNSELIKYEKDKTNFYNEIIIGLIYVELNKKNHAIMIFENFINKNPDMLITPDIEKELQKLIN